MIHEYHYKKVFMGIRDRSCFSPREVQTFLL